MKKLVICSILVLFTLSGALLWSQEWQLVGTLASDADAGETLLSVRWLGMGTEGYLVLIESRDGTVTETGEIKNIHGNFIILRERLQHAFVSGSKIYQ